MREILSPIDHDHIMGKVNTATGTALSHLEVRAGKKTGLEDVADNLNDILSGTQDPYIVTPKDLLEALNRSGYLNYFLQQTEGSAEILLYGIQELFSHIDISNRQYIKETDPGFTKAHIEAADFLKSVVEGQKGLLQLCAGTYANNDKLRKKLKENNYLLQQEDDLTEYAPDMLDTLADELFCQAVLNDIKSKKHANNYDIITRLSPQSDLDADYLSKEVLARRFFSFIATDEVTNAMKASKHYRLKPIKVGLLATYLSNLTDKELATLDRDQRLEGDAAEHAIDLHQSRKILDRVLKVVNTPIHGHAR